jgi:restriction endonuclease Mrr
MSKKRASLNLTDDDLDLSGFAPKGEKKRERPEPKTIEKIAEQSGFISRKGKRRRKRQRSPYQAQLNLKCREGVKTLFQELGDRLDVHDHTTFEEALLALIEKQGYSDLEARFRELAK